MWYNKPMENTAFSKQELNDLPKEALILLYIQMSEDFALLSDQNRMIQEQNELLLHQVEDLREQLAVLTQQRFGKKSEVRDQMTRLMPWSEELSDWCRKIKTR